MKRSIVTAYNVADLSHTQFNKAALWVVNSHVFSKAADGTLAPLAPAEAAFLANEFSTFMAMGARMKRDQYLLTGAVLGAAGMYVIMRWRKKRK